MGPSSVKSASRTIDIVEQIARRGPATAREISRTTEIPESSLSYLLATLVDRSWLYLGSDRTYSLGAAFAGLAAGTAPTFAERRRAQVKFIASSTGETSSLYIRRDNEIEAIDIEISSHILRFTPDKGMRVPLHCFAAGKVLLARMGADALDTYFATSNRLRFTPSTLVDEDELRRDIALTQKRGYALAVEEHTVGIVGMAVAADDQFSLSVAIPTPRFNPAFEHKAAALLLEAAKSLKA